MNQSAASKGVVIILVLFMMLGSVGVFILMQAMSNIFPDDHKVDRNYIFEGTVDGVECTGYGMSVYKAESEVEHVYFISYSLASSSVKYDDSFGIVFDRNDKPVEKICTFIKDDKIGDVDVAVWRMTDHGMTYDLYVGQICKIYRIDVSGRNVTAVGTVVE